MIFLLQLLYHAQHMACMQALSASRHSRNVACTNQHVFVCFTHSTEQEVVHQRTHHQQDAEAVLCHVDLLHDAHHAPKAAGPLCTMAQLYNVIGGEQPFVFTLQTAPNMLHYITFYYMPTHSGVQNPDQKQSG
jgi:hypothetical protein